MLAFVTMAIACSTPAETPEGATSSPAATGSSAPAECSGAVFDARRYDKVGQCLGPLEQVGCSTEELECGFIVVAAMGPDGTCWQFATDCVPSEFEPAAECEPAANAALCEENPQTGGGR